jgi:long-chain acyl-CoA synthetase
MGGNLALNLLRTAEKHPERPAIRLGATVISYAELAGWAGRASRLLRDRGVAPGDRVAVMLPNIPQFATSFYGALMAGAALVPLNMLLKRREISFQLRDSGARLALIWEGAGEEGLAAAREAGTECVLVRPGDFERTLAALEPDVTASERDGNDTAVILYTSGTTGTPKGAELTHHNLSGNVVAVLDMLDIGPEDVIFGALPLFHAFGQTCGLHTSIAAGSCLALMPRFEAEPALELIERDRVTIFEGVPTMYATLLNHPGERRYDLSTLRLCVSGGAALPLEVLRGFERAFDCIILEGYGLSETSPVASFNRPDRPRKPGSIGTPVKDVEMRVVDDAGEEVPVGEVGEIAVRGHNVMKGYWHLPRETAEVLGEEGWLRTGDLARRDADGYFFIVDRKKDMIIRGGFNVYPREVEEVLYEHPAVQECAVVGVPHPQLGEEVGAAIVLKPGTSAAATELSEFVKGRLAAYKYPRAVWFVDSLPKGSTGKILKREIEIPAEVMSAPVLR